MTTVKHVLAFLDDMAANTTLSTPTQSVIRRARKQLKKTSHKNISQTVNKIKSDIEYLETDEEVLPTELTELWQVSHMLEQIQEDNL